MADRERERGQRKRKHDVKKKEDARLVGLKVEGMNRRRLVGVKPDRVEGRPPGLYMALPGARHCTVHESEAVVACSGLDEDRERKNLNEPVMADGCKRHEAARSNRRQMEPPSPLWFTTTMNSSMGPACPT